MEQLRLAGLGVAPRLPACAGPGSRCNCCTTRSRGSAPGPAARPRCRRSWSTPKPISPEHNVTTRYGNSSRCRITSACPVSSSSASIDASGATNCTSSTFSNWCCRIMPRVSCRGSRLPNGNTGCGRRSGPAARRRRRSSREPGWSPAPPPSESGRTAVFIRRLELVFLELRAAGRCRISACVRTRYGT